MITSISKTTLFCKNWFNFRHFCITSFQNIPNFTPQPKSCYFIHGYTYHSTSIHTLVCYDVVITKHRMLKKKHTHWYLLSCWITKNTCFEAAAAHGVSKRLKIAENKFTQGVVLCKFLHIHIASVSGHSVRYIFKICLTVAGIRMTSQLHESNFWRVFDVLPNCAAFCRICKNELLPWFAASFLKFAFSTWTMVIMASLEKIHIAMIDTTSATSKNNTYL